MDIVWIFPPRHWDSSHAIPNHDSIHGVQESVVENAGMARVVAEECGLLEVKTVHDRTKYLWRSCGKNGINLVFPLSLNLSFGVKIEMINSTRPRLPYLNPFVLHGSAFQEKEDSHSQHAVRYRSFHDVPGITRFKETLFFNLFLEFSACLDVFRRFSLFNLANLEKSELSPSQYVAYLADADRLHACQSLVTN